MNLEIFYLFPIPLLWTGWKSYKDIKQNSINFTIIALNHINQINPF